jgi:hypothetical protein
LESTFFIQNVEIHDRQQNLGQIKRCSVTPVRISEQESNVEILETEPPVKQKGKPIFLMRTIIFWASASFVLAWLTLLLVKWMQYFPPKESG